MILVHKNNTTNSFVKKNWKEELGDWSEVLNTFLESDYIDYLVNFLDQKKKENKPIYPSIDKVFKPFKLTSFESLKVVLINSAAPLTKNASGLGPGISITTQNMYCPMSSFLQAMKNCIRDTVYYGMNIAFDASLTKLTDDGILCLNTSMTIQDNEDHSIYWKNFIRNVILNINSRKSNIIFLFLNGENSYFEKYIDTSKHHIVKNTNLYTIPQNSEIFTKVDSLMSEIYRDRYYITW